jgi:hypothetical protein
MSYTIEDHKHRFAAWAASRAASTITCRFNVLQGKEIIESVGLNRVLSDPSNLPTPTEIDAKHREWREAAIAAAKTKNLIGFSHGVAAKLINIYLKSAFVCAGYENHNHVSGLHPPIDSLLLEELYKSNVGDLKKAWGAAKKAKWSKFSSEQYEEVITNIRKALNGRSMWEIESCWRGYL